MDYRFPPDLQPFVDEMIAGGTYDNVHGLILHAVYLLRDHELTRRRKYEELKKEIQIGIDQLDRGEVAPLDLDEIFAEAMRRIGRQESQEEAG